MHAVVASFLESFWHLAAAMAPYLLLGFVLAGGMRVLFSERLVRRHLGGRGWKQSLRAVLIGIPLPICSCGVIPLAAALRRQGGRPGAVAAFTAATPQTGIDSILATYGLLGPLFTGLRLLAALASGLLAGWWVGRVTDQAPVQSGAPDRADACCAGSNCPEPQPLPGLRAGLRFGLWELPAELAGAVLLGFVLAAVLSTAIPLQVLTATHLPVVAQYLVVSLVAAPLYICSTGSIPLAFSLIQAGLSPGAALILLVAGPATSIATMTALARILGLRATAAYVAALMLTCWLLAALVDSTRIGPEIRQHMAAGHAEPSLYSQFLAGVLLLLLGAAWIYRFSRSSK